MSHGENSKTHIHSTDKSNNTSNQLDICCCQRYETDVRGV